jgi:hypothetical protein
LRSTLKHIGENLGLRNGIVDGMMRVRVSRTQRGIDLRPARLRNGDARLDGKRGLNVETA